jgi:predicted AAA+ superfamily ATPase
MYPLTCQELKEQFHLKNSILYGQLPAVFSEPDPLKYLQSYIHAYIREEVLQEGLTRNLSGFARFLEIASFSQGQLINVAEISREISVHRKVVESYFEILADLLLAYRLPVFTKRSKRKLVVHSKFYFFDVGVYRAIRPMGALDRPEEAEGMALETLVFQELKAINDYFDLGYSLYFWRTAGDHEVDFVLYGQKGFIAIEVKRSSHLSPHDLRALKTFGEDYPESKRFLFYRGNEKRFIDGIKVIPIEDALRNLPKLLS